MSDTVTVWVGDDGPKKLTDMTKEELIDVVEELGSSLKFERDLSRKEREMWLCTEEETP